MFSKEKEEALLDEQVNVPREESIPLANNDEDEVFLDKKLVGQDNLKVEIADAGCNSGAYGELSLAHSIVMVVSAFIVQFACLGFINNFGSVISHLIVSFASDTALFASIGNVIFSMVFMMGIFLVSISKYLGLGLTYAMGCLISALSLTLATYAPSPYVILLTYGAMFGIGASFMFLTTIFISTRYFSTNTVVVAGIISCGSSVGSFAQAMFLNKVCTKYSWKIVFRVYSVVFSVLSLLGFVFHVKQKPKKHQKLIKSKVQNTNQNILMSILEYFDIYRNVSYCFLTASIVTFVMGYLTPFAFIKQFAQTRGISDNKASALVGIGPVASLAGRIILPALAKYGDNLKIIILTVSFTLMGISTALATTCQTYVHFIVYMCVFGFAEAPFVTMISSIVKDLFCRLNGGPGDDTKEFREQKAERATAVIFFLHAPPMILASFMNGFIISKYGNNYFMLFMVSAIYFIVAAALCGVVLLLERSSEDS